MAKQAKASTKFERLHHLLKLLGENEINVDEFWRRMDEHALTDADIDEYCRMHHAGALRANFNGR